MIEEGIAREIISKVQQLRKSKDFNIVDRIHLLYDTSDNEVVSAINNFKSLIMKETLATQIDKELLETEIDNINGYSVKIDVVKVK